MPFSLKRRHFLLAAAAAPLAYITAASADENANAASAHSRFEVLEASSGGRLGVYAVNTANGARISYRANERFPLCSTFKVILAAAILARSIKVDNLLQQRIVYTSKDIVPYSPVSEKHIDAGMSVAELCAAALQYSDNTAANLLIRILGGPADVTAYARSIGNHKFRLDRWETALNTAIPGDPRDTATPAAMAHSLQSLVLGNALPAMQRTQLKEWMLGNTTGEKRIRAATSAGWQTADKTGSGDYGTANDIAVVWPPEGPPVVLAIYHTHARPDATWHDAVIAAAAKIAIATLS